MPDGPPVVIAALSGRALAAAARRAGYQPLVADLFDDMDTRRIATASARLDGDLASGLDPKALPAAIAALAAPFGGVDVPLAYGAGFEDRPELLETLAQRHPLLGNPADVVRRLKDPRGFFSTLRRLGLPHPETRVTEPTDGRGWLEKRIGASGGGHIRAASKGVRHRRNVYYQRRVSGRPTSACFLADGRRARLIGFSMPIAASGPATFRFAGAVQPTSVPESARRAMIDAIDALAPAFGLVGLNSADFVLAGGGPLLLEVNPRPGATVDIFDRMRPAYLFRAHIAACRGHLPDGLPPIRPAACAVIYADRRLTVGNNIRWPRWAADIPPPGTRIRRNQPVCTVIARTGSAAAASALLAARSASIRQMLSRAVEPRSTRSETALRSPPAP